MHDHDEPFLQRRDRLPEVDGASFAIPGRWGLIKDFVGMDLATVCFPSFMMLCCTTWKNKACLFYALVLHFTPENCNLLPLPCR